MSDAPTTPVAVPAKPWWRSKTIWFNVAVAMFAAGQEFFHFLQPILRADFYAVIFFVLAIGNAALRIISAARLTK